MPMPMAFKREGEGGKAGPIRKKESFLKTRKNKSRWGGGGLNGLAIGEGTFFAVFLTYCETAAATLK